MNDDARYENKTEVPYTAGNLALLLAAAVTLSVDPRTIVTTSLQVVLAPDAVVTEAGLGMVPA